MDHNNDPMTSTQRQGIQGNPPGLSPIELYFLQIQNCLNSTLHQISALQKSDSALEARVISIQRDANRPDERQGEPSFVVKSFTGDKKERTE